jgi:PAS domain S-box-containing protein
MQTMILSLARRLGVKQQGLVYKLSVIKALLSILPLLILSYIFYENKISLELPQVFLIPLSLVLILGGFVILRQIFDRVRMIATSIKQAEASGSGWIDTQQDTAELHQIAICFNSLMNKFELTTTELQQRVFELFAIKELIEVASMSIDLDALLNALLEKAMAVSKAQIGSVYEVEPEGQRFRIVARRGLESGPKKGSYIDISESMAGPVVFTKRPLLVQDIETDPRTRKQNDPEYGPPSFLSMPISVRGNLIAVLNLSHKETKQVFDSNDEHILSIMIGKVSFALENAQLHAEAEKHVRDLQERSVDLSNANVQLRQEINERERAEEALNETNEFLKNILDSSSSISIISTDNESNVLFWNKGAENLLGYKAEEMVGREKIDKLYSEDQKESLIEKVRSSVLKDKKQVRCEVREIKKSGRKIWVGLTLTPRFNDEGQVVGILGIGEDITERKKAEEKIEKYSKNLEIMVEQRTDALNRALYAAGEARDRLDAILKSIADGLIVTDRYHRIMLMNRAAEDLLDIRLSQVINRPMDLAFEDKTVRDRIKTTLEKKKAGHEFDFELPRGDTDHPRVMRARTSVITDKAGKQTGVITILHNVT